MKSSLNVAPAGQARPPSTRFIIAFALIFLVFYVAYTAIPDNVLAEHVYYWLFNRPAANVLGWLGHDDGLVAQGHRLFSARVNLEIVRGCDGAGACFLLSAAVLAYPAPWLLRVGGAVLGTLVLGILNIARIVGLYLVLEQRPEWFTTLHSFVVPLLILACAGLYYSAYLAYLDRQPRVEPT